MIHKIKLYNTFNKHISQNSTYQIIFINQKNTSVFLCNLKKRLYLTTDSVVLLEQIRVLDKQRLQARLGRLPYSYIQKIDKALAVSIGLWDKC